MLSHVLLPALVARMLSVGLESEPAFDGMLTVPCFTFMACVPSRGGSLTQFRHALEPFRISRHTLFRVLPAVVTAKDRLEVFDGVVRGVPVAMVDVVPSRDRSMGIDPHLPMK